MNPTKPDYEAWKSEILARMDTSKTVLAIIDMQRDFCSPDGALAALGSDVSTSREVADRIDEFLPKVRE